MRCAFRSKRILCEALENRQLMSLTIEVRNADGSAAATATSIGQILNLEVLGVISNASNPDPTQYGLQDVDGSFISTADGKHSVAGNLAASNIAPFKASGAAPGTRQDLNGDGNIDDGSVAPFNTTGYFFARSSPLQDSSTGTIVGNTLQFKIATLTYTVTSLNAGGQTSINFAPYVNPGGLSAEWTENGFGLGDQTNSALGTFQAGTPLIVSDPNLVTAPTAVDDTFAIPGETSSTLNVLANDDVIDPLNDASLLVTSGPVHGTAQPQSNGTILYTPTSAYRGSDSFTYTVADVDGHVSNPATVNLTVVSTPAPVAANFGASAFANQAISVDVLSHVTSNGTVNPASVLVASQPSHGTAAVQSDGSIQYAPSENFIGTDTFTYSAGDSNNETSNVATVTVTVTQPVPPTAKDDNFNVSAGTATVLNVQANDKVGSVAIAGLVTVGVLPKHGTATVQDGGNVLYTPTAGYVGTDSFEYIDTDILGDISAIATATITVAAATVVVPTANPVSAQLPSGQSTAINVLANDTGAVPDTVKVVTGPTNGTATANADGTVSYASVAGFVGNDSFTFTFADAGGSTSAPATVNVQVGARISNTKGAAHSIRFTDAVGGIETISLNKGTADIFFSGFGSLTIAKNGKGTLTGAGVDITNIMLSNTTRASSLSMKGSTKTPVNVGGISDSSTLGSFAAPSANITGDINLSGTGSIAVGKITNSAINIGSGVPTRFSLSTATVTGSSLNSSVLNTSIKSTSWNGPISAASITSVTIKTGGMASNISAGSIGTINIGGSLTGNIETGSMKSLKVTGDINGSTIGLEGTVGQLTAASLTNSKIIYVAGSLLAPAFLNIGSIRLTGKTGNDFTNSNITANKINSLSLGTIATSNNAASFGINAPLIDSFTGTFGTTVLHLGRSQLKNQSVLAAYVAQQGAVFGDFVIQLSG